MKINDEKLLDVILESTRAGITDRAERRWQGFCPAHDDKNPSLSIKQEKNGTILLFCHAGCKYEQIMKALKINGCGSTHNLGGKTMKKNGETMKSKIVAIYDYQDETEKLLYQVVRYDPKGFSQRRPDGKGGWINNLENTRRVLYRLPELLKADPNRNVFIVEGEKDVDRLYEYSFLATTCSQGAGKWKSVEEHAKEVLKNRNIVIIPDNDKPGKNHALQVAKSLDGIAKSIKIIQLPNLPEKGDISDWFDNKGTPDKLRQIVNSTRIWKPVDKSLLELGIKSTEKSSKEPPHLLVREPSPPQPFPMETMGEILCNAAMRIRDVIQAPDALCAQSVLAAACLAVQGFANIEIDGREYPISEFFITIGESGERKSAVDKIALHQHALWQKKKMERYEDDLKSYDQEKMIYNKTKDEALSHKNRGRENKRDALQEMGPPPEEPLLPMLIFEEPTFEGLCKMLYRSIPSVGLFTDEGGRFIGGQAMREENQIKTASGLSNFWDGRPVSRIRVGDGNYVLFGKRLTLHLMTQPVIAQLLLSNPLLLNQGLISRCLICQPESTCGKRMYKPVNIYNTSEMIKYFQRIEHILDTPLLTEENFPNQLRPRKIYLTDSAKSLWIKYHNAVETQLLPNGKLHQIRGFGNKLAEHALRLSGIIALFHNLNVQTINEELMSYGIKLATFYAEEALRCTEAAVIDPDLIEAQKLLDWLHNKEKKEITLVEIYQSGPNSIRTVRKALPIVEILEKHEWLIKLDKGAMYKDVHRKDAWGVVYE